MASMNKVIFPKKTRITLHERFTALQARNRGLLRSIRQKSLFMQQASARNRRLAQQMENRPAVIAALKLKKKSLQQRLGIKNNIRNRLSLNTGTWKRNRRNRNRFGTALKQSKAGFLRKKRLGKFGKGSLTFSNKLSSKRKDRGALTMKIGGRSTRGHGRVIYTANMKNGVFRFRGRGRLRGRWQNGKNLTKEQLDNQLDEYMARTKSHLDAELDAYMNETKTIGGLL